MIIVGAGRVGRHLANLLIEKKNEVALIERDKEKSEEVSREIDALIINGNGTQVKTLEEANARSADALVAATGKDEINLLSALVAKNMGVKIVISRVSNPEYKEVFKKLGIDFVVSPEATAAEHIEKLIRRPSSSDLAILEKSGLEILEFKITKDSKIAEKTVGEIRPEGFLIMAVYKNGVLSIPSAKT
ncbi:MAG: TrkA family potassium uptake protein, partial [Methanobacteriota archaeon]